MAEELLEQQKEKKEEEMQKLKEERAGLKDELADLKSKLYGRFGKNINLEEPTTLSWFQFYAPAVAAD